MTEVFHIYQLKLSTNKYIFCKIQLFNFTTTNSVHETFWAPTDLRLRMHRHHFHDQTATPLTLSKYWT